MIAVIMFFNGLCIMVLEMVGARLLAPWLGTSIIVWTSLIGVILACLSLGYWLGGRLGDAVLAHETPGKGQGKQAQEAHAGERAFTILSSILLCISLFVLLTGVAQEFVLSSLAVHVRPLHLAAVCAAVLLFSGPSILCGMVSPYAMRLAITDSRNAGEVIGKLNAIATLGSILGTFLGGFVLISWFGSREIIFGIACCFLAAACFVRLRPLRNKMVVGGVLVACIGLQTGYDALARSDSDFTIETMYNTLRINDGMYNGKPMRMLSTAPGGCQSGAWLDAPHDLTFPYTQYYSLPTVLRPQSSRVLMLGGGGYTVPKWLLAGKSALEAEQLQLDVVELDPGMTRAARDYFWLADEDPRMRIFHEDARIFLHQAALKAEQEDFVPYQLIFADVFNSYYSVPFHMGTVEAARQIRTLLTPDGLVMMNIISAIEGDDGRLLRSIYSAFSQVFPHVAVFPVLTANPEVIQNVMLMASPSSFALNDDELKLLPPKERDYMMRRWTYPLTPDVPPLMDNFAPVERYLLRAM